MPIDPWITDGVAACRGTLIACQTPTSKVIITDATRSSAHIYRNPGDLSQTGRDGTTPWNRNTYIRPPRLNYSVLIGGGTTAYPTITGIQQIFIPKGV